MTTSKDNDDATLQGLTREKEFVDLKNIVEHGKLEGLRLLAEQRKLMLPWWRSWNITALAALVAAITPVTAGVQEYFQKQTALELEVQKQDHQMELEQQKQVEQIYSGYLDRIADPHSRRRVLRFLAVTSSNPRVQEWARREVEIVDQEVAESRQEYVQEQEHIDKLKQEIERTFKEAKRDDLLLQHKLDEFNAALLRLKEKDAHLNEVGADGVPDQVDVPPPVP